MSTDQVNLPADLDECLRLLAKARFDLDAAKAHLRATEESVASVLAEPTLAVKVNAERVKVLDAAVRQLAVEVYDTTAQLPDGVQVVRKREKMIADKAAAFQWLLQREFTDVLGVVDEKRAITIGEAANASWVLIADGVTVKVATDLSHLLAEDVTDETTGGAS